MSCYENCNQYKWYEFQKRRNCIADCDAASYQLNANETQETISLQMETTKTTLKYVFLFCLLIVIAALIAKYKNWI